MGYYQNTHEEEVDKDEGCTSDPDSCASEENGFSHEMKNGFYENTHNNINNSKENKVKKEEKDNGSRCEDTRSSAAKAAASQMSSQPLREIRYSREEMKNAERALKKWYEDAYGWIACAFDLNNDEERKKMEQSDEYKNLLREMEEKREVFKNKYSCYPILICLYQIIRRITVNRAGRIIIAFLAFCLILPFAFAEKEKSPVYQPSYAGDPAFREFLDDDGPIFVRLVLEEGDLEADTLCATVREMIRFGAADFYDEPEEISLDEDGVLRIVAAWTPEFLAEKGDSNDDYAVQVCWNYTDSILRYKDLDPYWEKILFAYPDGEIELTKDMIVEDDYLREFGVLFDRIFFGE